MRIPAVAAVAVLSLVAGSCADAPTQPKRDLIAPEQSPAASRVPAGHAGLLMNMRISEPLAGGGSFVGAVSITRFRFDTESRELTATVRLHGRAVKPDGGAMKTADGRAAVVPSVTLTGVPVKLSRPTTAASAGGLIHPAQASCDILFLDLGPIHLDLLGLVLDVSPIQIDLDAQPGSGNLLGNLLCALLGLLDPLGSFALILQLLEVINNILENLINIGGGFAA